MSPDQTAQFFALLLIAWGLWSIANAIRDAGRRIARALWHGDHERPPTWLDHNG